MFCINAFLITILKVYRLIGVVNGAGSQKFMSKVWWAGNETKRQHFRLGILYYYLYELCKLCMCIFIARLSVLIPDLFLREQFL